jgi:hypothetical protein
MWVDRAFDMGINFSDIFRRINKVGPLFWHNYHRGTDRQHCYKQHDKSKTPIAKEGRDRTEHSIAGEDMDIIGTFKQMITERLTGTITVQLTREWEMKNGKGDFIPPWLNRPINKEEAIQINELIKAIERIGTTDMDSVVEEATGVQRELWNLTDNVHTPSRDWSSIGKQRIQREGKKREDSTKRERTKEDPPGPHGKFEAKDTRTAIEQLRRIAEIDQRFSTEHKRELDKEIAIARKEYELEEYEGRPHSGEHNMIPRQNQAKRGRGRDQGRKGAKGTSSTTPRRKGEGGRRGVERGGGPYV